tara:strand:+ start:9789 stop:10874 length:1086 start_codon:yes stop_codon:yes gene_type:complete
MAFDEKPQAAIIVKNASASRIQLSADNFVGYVVSYIQKADIEGKDGTSLEWVREDQRAVRAHDPTGASFPSDPGIYYVTWETDTSFMVDILKEVKRERLGYYSLSDVSEGESVTVSAGSIHEGSLRVYVDEIYQLVEDTHYSVDYGTGTITWLENLSNEVGIYADYFYAAPSTGPYTIEGANTFNNTAIPGVILAFGDQTHAGDQNAIVITDKRTMTAQEYGGQWDISISFDIMAQDKMQMEQIADYTVMEIWGRKKNLLEREGLVITDMSHGGEADEVYDETGDTPYYLASMDLQIRTDWAIHIPIPFEISAISFVDSVSTLNSSSDEDVVSIPSTLKVVPNLSPYMARHGLSNNFERIV